MQEIGRLQETKDTGLHAPLVASSAAGAVHALQPSRNVCCAADKHSTHRAFYSIRRKSPAEHHWQRDCRPRCCDQAAQTDQLGDLPGSLVDSTYHTSQHNPLEDRKSSQSQPPLVCRQTGATFLHSAQDFQQHQRPAQVCPQQDLSSSHRQLVQTSGPGVDLAIHSARDTQRAQAQHYVVHQPSQSTLTAIEKLSSEQARAVRQGQPHVLSGISSNKAALPEEATDGRLSTAAMLDHFPPPVNVSLENWNLAALRSDPNLSSPRNFQVMKLES